MSIFLLAHNIDILKFTLIEQSISFCNVVVKENKRIICFYFQDIENKYLVTVLHFLKLGKRGRNIVF